ncbi:MAG: caspase family protein [Cyanobacteria bacterium J06626_18]
MTQIHRRQLLQGALATLAALGWEQYSPLWDSQALAQSTPRKLALLIGINDYQDETITPLRGCITDVQLQEQLLRDHYGFQSADILTLLDGEATRSGILNAIETHLIQQASPGDIVVLHFSGHTIFVSAPNCEMDDCLMGVLMPVDGTFPAIDDWLSTVNSVPQGGISRTELEDVISRLATDQLTILLDVVGGGSFATETGFVKGVLLAASTAEQLATETVFDGVHAGLFTHTLTRYLWQQSDEQSFAAVMDAIAPEVQALSEESGVMQTPMLFSEPNRDHSQQPIYFTVPQIS